MDEVAGLEKDGVEKHLQEALADQPDAWRRSSASSAASG